jgi:hypothetical protein
MRQPIEPFYFRVKFGLGNEVMGARTTTISANMPGESELHEVRSNLQRLGSAEAERAQGGMTDDGTHVAQHWSLRTDRHL